ncbi:MAG: helix-hairpin-helix domain-containing protein [Ruminococcaceae bacterium]|nr:helix-hairpin-helix domain-containing protein [Oscillospiraceae bacterium]
MSGGELYYDNAGNERKEAVEQTSVERIVINEKAYIVNINTASKAELMDIPLIGEKTAERIISYRKDNPFKEAVDIMGVEGIGEKTYATIKEYICVD